MILLRFLLTVFNVAVIGFLIYKMIGVARSPGERTRKAVFLAGGIILLLAPVGIFLKFFSASPQYFLIYPVAIVLFLYLTRQL